MNPVTIKHRREFIQRLISVAPRFVLCVHIPLEELVGQPSLKEDPEVKKLFEFIQANYDLQEFPDHRFLYAKVASSTRNVRGDSAVF